MKQIDRENISFTSGIDPERRDVLNRAIAVRISRRTYEGLALSDEERRAMQVHIDAARSESGLNIYQIEDGSRAFEGIMKSYGIFRGVRSLIVLAGAKSDPHLREKCGYYGERLILEATGLGLGTCWIGGTFDRSDPMFVCGSGEEVICVITIGRIHDKRTLKEQLLHALSHRKTKTVEQLYSTDSPTPDWFAEGMKAVQRAPSAKNTQKFSFRYHGGTISVSVPDDYTFDRVDLGIAKLHFEIACGGRFEFGNGGVFHPEA